MSHTTTQPKVNIINALQKMQHTAILFVVAYVISQIRIQIRAPPFPYPDWFEQILPLVGVGVVLTVFVAIILLIGLYAMFIPGLSDLAQVNTEFSGSLLLIKIGYLFGLVLFIIGSIMMGIILAQLTSIDVVVLIIAGYVCLASLILIFVGDIGVCILCYKLNSLYGGVLYVIAILLIILGTPFTILKIPAWLLVFAALQDTIKKLQTSTTQGFTQGLS
ncbi:MAG: hypothetical protein QN229_03360 [Desulfurococcaceae archaeon TW002]